MRYFFAAFSSKSRLKSDQLRRVWPCGFGSKCCKEQQRLAATADKGIGFGQQRWPMWCDRFLATMEQIVPRFALCAVIEPCYPKTGAGRSGADAAGVVGAARLTLIDAACA
ncbi:hypothetical protein LMG919_08235 [Xanthomonas vesicatoria]|nr:hypothetical protein LMG919_08235 [Xanthomonas vesicatoria]